MSRTFMSKLVSAVWLVLAAMAFVFGSSNLAAAQDQEKTCTEQCIEGFSIIIPSDSSTPGTPELDTFSETFVTPDLVEYYGAYVEGYLYQNGYLIGEGWAYEYPYFNDACIGPSELNLDPDHPCGDAPEISVTVGDTYRLESDHYVVAYFYGFNDYGDPIYYNPGGLEFTNGGSDYPSGWDFTPGGGEYYVYTEFIYLGTTAYEVTTGKPSISSISPTGASLGASDTLTIQGENLVDQYGTSTPSITGSGVTLSAPSPNDDGTVSLHYSIASNATRGPRSITVSTNFGTSNAVTFTVGDASPTVTSVSPNEWDAGTTIPNVIIGGTGFGLNPSLTISGTGVHLNNYSVTGANQISASVTIDLDAPDGTATVTVESKGYDGNGFLNGKPGQSSTGSNTVQVRSVTIVPKIVFGNDSSACDTGTDISQQEKSIVVGQKVALVGCPPKGLSIASHSWSTPPGTSISAFQIDSTCKRPIADATCSASVRSLQGQDLQQQKLAFYWADSDTADRILQYTYTTSTGVRSTNWVEFIVNGPTGTNQFAPTGAIDIFNGNPPFLGFGDDVQWEGIDFKIAQIVPPENSGQFSLVQIITAGEVKSRIYDLVTTWVPSILLANSGGVLDTSFPYAFGTHAADSPNITLPQDIEGLSEIRRKMSARMYAMWTPSQAANCNGSDCVVPVPLGHWDWSWCGDAVNTNTALTQLSAPLGKNGTWWVLVDNHCDQNPSFHQDSSYPTWGGTIRKGDPDTCTYPDGSACEGN
jgi:hypothetical protein